MTATHAPRSLLVLLVLAPLSGAAALLYQVVWSRLLTLEIGLTAAAVSTVLAAFMGGLALGAALTGRLAARWSARRALAVYAALELAVGLAALGVAPALAWAHPLLSAVYQDGAGGFAFAALRLLVCLLTVAIPATLMGATFPLAVRWLERPDTQAGRIAGRFHTANTLGAALGAGLTGFVLLPAAGLHRATLVGAALNAIVAISAFAICLVSRQAHTEMVEMRAGGPLAPPLTPRRAAPPAYDFAMAPPRPGTRGRGAVTVNIPAVEWSARPHPNAAAIALAISGFLALVHEVAWTRVIALSVGPTTYAFSTMLTTCILGLAAGAAFATRRLPHMRRPVTGLAVTQIAAALGAFFAVALVPRLPGALEALAGPTYPYGSTLAIEGLLIGLLLLPLTLALGAAFPFGVATAVPVAEADGETARAAARVYTANTLGAIGGALAGGFVLIPQLGLRRTIVLAGLLGILAGVELIWRTRRRGRARIWVPIVGLLAAAVGLTLPAWDPAQLASGLYDRTANRAPDRNPAGALTPDGHSAHSGADSGAGTSPAPPRVSLATLADLAPVGLAEGALLYYDDGAAGTVAVRRLAGTIGLAINGTQSASNGDDMLGQALLAHLPLLLHAAPHDVCVIGLGSGVTAGAALAHPIDRVDTIELSREVVRASDLFSTENRAALRDPRHHLLIGDGRTHVRLARRTYDVVISEPSNPWIAGAAPLFTRELFLAARDRLADGGLFAQRLHLRGIGRADLPSILATFTSVFPHAAVWLIGDSELIVIGGREPVTPRLADLPRRWQVPGVAADLERVEVRDPFALLSMFVADESALRGLLAGAPLQTDDRTDLEFSAPWGLQDRGDPVAWLLESRLRDARPDLVTQAEATATAAQWRDRARMLAGAGAPALAYDAAARALAQNPTDGDALTLLARTAIVLHREPAALTLVEAFSARAPDSLAVLLTLSRLREATGRTGPAIEAATAATEQFPQAVESWEQLAALLIARRDAAGLGRILESMEAQFPDRWQTRYVRAAWHLLRDEPSEAVRVGEAILRERASEPRTLALLGTAYARLGVRDRARDALEACIQSDPRHAASYVQLARLELDTFNPRRAASLFAEALILDPRSADALNGLADALTGLGRGDRAAALRARAAGDAAAAVTR